MHSYDSYFEEHNFMNQFNMLTKTENFISHSASEQAQTEINNENIAKLSTAELLKRLLKNRPKKKVSDSPKKCSFFVRAYSPFVSHSQYKTKLNSSSSCYNSEVVKDGRMDNSAKCDVSKCDNEKMDNSEYKNNSVSNKSDCENVKLPSYSHSLLSKSQQEISENSKFSTKKLPSYKDTILSKLLDETQELPQELFEDGTIDFLLNEAEKNLNISSPRSDFINQFCPETEDQSNITTFCESTNITFSTDVPSPKYDTYPNFNISSPRNYGISSSISNYNITSDINFNTSSPETRNYRISSPISNVTSPDTRCTLSSPYTEYLPISSPNSGYISSPTVCVSSPNSVQSDCELEYTQLQPVRANQEFSTDSKMERGVSVDSGYQTSSTDGNNLKGVEIETSETGDGNDDDDNDDDEMIMVPNSK